MNILRSDIRCARSGRIAYLWGGAYRQRYGASRTGWLGMPLVADGPNVNPGNRRYRQNIVVYAVPVG
jgi:hypothetical protein